jgi:hypothetical protein
LPEITFIATAVLVVILLDTNAPKSNPGIIKAFATIVPATITLPALTLPVTFTFAKYEVPLKPIYR